MFLKNNCPDRVNNAVSDGRNRDKIDVVIKSGHRAKDVDKLDVNGVSGHISGQVIE